MKSFVQKRYILISIAASFLFVIEQNKLNLFALTKPSALAINVVFFGIVAYMGYKYFTVCRKVLTVVIFSLITAVIMCLSILFRQIADIQTIHYIRTFISAICLTPAISFFISWILEKLSYIRKSEDNNYRKRNFWIYFGIILICWLPGFLAYFPGITAYDCGNQIQQVLSGDYSTHHPLLHTLLLGGFYLFGKRFNNINLGIAFYSLFQSAILAMTFAYSLQFLHKRNVNRILRLLLLIFYTLFPIHPILAISATKDVFFTAFFLLFFLFSIELIEPLETKNGSYIGFIISGILVFLFRNNARYVLGLWTVVFCIMLWRTHRKDVKKGIIAILLIIVLGKGIDFGTVLLTNAQKGSIKEMLSVPMMQMGRCLAYSRDEMDEETIEEFKQLNFHQGAYTSHCADTQKKELKYEGNEKEFWRLWFCLFKKHPMTYINAFLYLQEGAWSLDDISIGNVYNYEEGKPIGYLATFTVEGFGIESNSLLPTIRKGYESLFTRNVYQNFPILSLLFLPIFYICLVLLTMIKKKRSNSTFLSGWLIILYYFSLLLGPCCIIRYHYPIVISAVVLFCYEFGINGNSICLLKTKSQTLVCDEDK